jgi:TPR repeat protein
MNSELIQNFGGSFAAIAYFEHAAEMGMGTAQHRLGLMHETGLYGVHVNISKAYHYYELAANSGNAQAMLALSRLCNHGIQMPQDQSEQMAALFEQDESDWINKSVRNEDAAFRWCHLAADKQLTEACYLLG